MAPKFKVICGRSRLVAQKFVCLSSPQPTVAMAGRRLRMSKNADVSFLESVMESWMAEAQSRDIVGLVRDADAESWRTAPRVRTLVGMSGVVKNLITKVPHRIAQGHTCMTPSDSKGGRRRRGVFLVSSISKDMFAFHRRLICVCIPGIAGTQWRRLPCVLVLGGEGLPRAVRVLVLEGH